MYICKLSKFTASTLCFAFKRFSTTEVLVNYIEGLSRILNVLQHVPGNPNTRAPDEVQ